MLLVTAPLPFDELAPQLLRTPCDNLRRRSRAIRDDKTLCTAYST